MRLGADDPQTYEDALASAIEEEYREDPVEDSPTWRKFFGYPLVAVGFLIMSAGYGLLNLGRVIAGQPKL